jgi:hypothetical protein
MGVATKKPRFAVVFLMIFTLGVSLGLPAVDVLDAVYDESEAVPYEVVPLPSMAAQPAAARTTQATLSSLHLKPNVSSPLPPARVRDTDANRSADARISLALLCALLC